MDRFDQFTTALADPGTSAVPIVPSDADPLAEVPRAIWVGTGGTIVLRGRDDAADTIWANVPDGSLLPFRPAYVRATGTTAADMLAIY